MCASILYGGNSRFFVVDRKKVVIEKGNSKVDGCSAAAAAGVEEEITK